MTRIFSEKILNDELPNCFKIDGTRYFFQKSASHIIYIVFKKYPSK